MGGREHHKGAFSSSIWGVYLRYEILVLWTKQFLKREGCNALNFSRAD